MPGSAEARGLGFYTNLITSALGLDGRSLPLLLLGAALFGALGGPAAYYAGAQLGALRFEQPWPGLVDVEAMPGDAATPAEDAAATSEPAP